MGQAEGTSRDSSTSGGTDGSKFDDQSGMSALARKEHRQARELSRALLDSLDEAVERVALHALGTLGDEVSARAWLDRRVRGPITQVIADVLDGKRPSTAASITSAPTSSIRPTTDQSATASKNQPPRATTNSTKPSALSTKQAPKAAITGRAPGSKTLAAPQRGAATAAKATRDAVEKEPSLAELSAVIEKKRADEGPRSQAASPHPAASRPPAPPAFSSGFQQARPSTQPLAQSSRTSRPPPPPWREAQSGADSGDPHSSASLASGKRARDSMPPPPSTRRRELETLIPPVRKSEEDLIEPLTRKLQALKFVEDRAEAARFILELALEVAPARTGLVHLYDTSTRQFVALAAVGDKAMALDSWASDEADDMLNDALRKRQLVHITAPRKNPHLNKGRWAVLQPKHAVVCVPCARAGKRLGAIELVDPHEREEFARNQLNALTFLATELSRFLDQKPATQATAS